MHLLALHGPRLVLLLLQGSAALVAGAGETILAASLPLKRYAAD
jgi:hypothetical protein